jgi:hypothetical protein
VALFSEVQNALTVLALYEGRVRPHVVEELWAKMDAARHAETLTSFHDGHTLPAPRQ